VAPIPKYRVPTAKTAIDQRPILQGACVHPGVASGPVFVVSNLDVMDVPKGAILVTATMDPEIAKVMPLAGGLISERGSPTTHLATIAREFNKPTIIHTKEATRLLRHGECVTLDAANGRVFRGRIASLFTQPAAVQATPEAPVEVNRPLIKHVMRDIVPLTLTHIPSDYTREVMMKSEDFRTIHDIIRYVHEVSVREVFRFGGTREGDVAHILNLSGVPMQFYVIDIGNGLIPEATFKRKIMASDITCESFRSLVAGMTHEGVSWAGPVEFDLAGFFSVASRSFVRTDITDRGGRAYVLLSRDYLNFHSRLAYHFTVVDAMCTDVSDNNYVTFRFGGGGAEAGGRARRALLLKEILESFNFRVGIKGDTVSAMFRPGDRAGIQRRLDQLGRLMGYTRQLDMCLKTEEDQQRYIQAFLDGDYSAQGCRIPQRAY